MQDHVWLRGTVAAKREVNTLLHRQRLTSRDRMQKKSKGDEAQSNVLKGTACPEGDSQGSFASHLVYVEAFGMKRQSRMSSCLICSI